MGCWFRARFGDRFIGCGDVWRNRAGVAYPPAAAACTPPGRPLSIRSPSTKNIYGSRTVAASLRATATGNMFSVSFNHSVLRFNAAA